MLKHSRFLVLVFGSVCSGVTIDSHACTNRNEGSCITLANAKKNTCGSWCPETRQCLPTNVKYCPLGEAGIPGDIKRLAYCDSLPAAQCVTTLPGTIADLGVCRGFCVPLANGDGDGDVNIDAGKCIPPFVACPKATHKLLTKLEEIPCENRHTCFDCFTLKFGKLKEWAIPEDDSAGPNCVWCEKTNQCTQRAHPKCSDPDPLLHHGFCPEEPTDTI